MGLSTALGGVLPPLHLHHPLDLDKFIFLKQDCLRPLLPSSPKAMNSRYEGQRDQRYLDLKTFRRFGWCASLVCDQPYFKTLDVGLLTHTKHVQSQWPGLSDLIHSAYSACLTSAPRSYALALGPSGFIFWVMISTQDLPCLGDPSDISQYASLQTTIDPRW